MNPHYCPTNKFEECVKITPCLAYIPVNKRGSNLGYCLQYDPKQAMCERLDKNGHPKFCGNRKCAHHCPT